MRNGKLGTRQKNQPASCRRRLRFCSFALQALEQFEKTQRISDGVNLAHFIAIHGADFRRADAASAASSEREHLGLEIDVAALCREAMRLDPSWIQA